MSEIFEVPFNEEGRRDFLTYSEEVLTDRAVPSAEDGLLSSQRKIIWTMENFLKMNSKSKTKKCNSIVGSTLMTSYVHGNMACYGVLTKMVQPYLMRYPLLVGQGALGTQESNDMVASDRYTEAKPSIFADLMMSDYEKKVVPTKRTYNDEYDEPVVLPSIFPNALCNGKQTIAIGLAHCSMPHNLTEVCNGIIAYINNKDNITISELMKYIPGPDFPLKNTIINKNVIKEAFETGHSAKSLRVRGEYEIKDNKIIFNTIPYRVYRNKIKEQINNNIEEFEKIISDFDDESNLGQNKLIFTLKKGVSAATALKKIFKLTDLETTLSYNMNYIVNGTPKLCSILDLIKAYYNHQLNVLIKATEYDLDKAKKRAHILEGLMLAIDKIDEVIELIKKSENKDKAKQSLMQLLSISEVQANAILDMKLAKLTKIDKEELYKELQEKKKIIEECNKIINDKNYADQILISKIEKLKDTYGDERRTTLLDLPEELKEDKEIADVEPEKCVVVMTESGLIKRIPTSSFRTQKRNGKGIKTQDDVTSYTIRTNTIDSLMIFSNQGKMYRILVNDIPVGTNVSKGTSITNLVQMELNEKPNIIYSLYRDTDAKFVLFTTKKGLVKKTALEEYTKTRKKTGMAAINLRENDSIASVNLIKDEDIILITKKGMAIRIKSTDVGAMGRMTGGVKGINLNEGDYVIATLPIRETTDQLAIIAENGLGKKFNLSELLTQNRGGKGLICYKGSVAGAALIENTDLILIVGDKNSVCISAEEIPLMSRIALGNQLIKTNKVKSVTKV